MSPAPRRLEGLVESVRRHLARGALFAATLWVVAAAAGVLILAWMLAGPDGWRQGSDVPLLLDLAWVAVAAATVVLLRRGAVRWFSEAPLSRAIERAAGVKPGLVRGSLELSRRLPQGVSPRLVARAAEHTLAELGRPIAELSGELGAGVRAWTRRGSIVLAMAVVALTLLAAVSPARAGRAWLGLSAPVRVMADPVLPPLTLLPGTIEVPRGSDIDVRLEAPGRSEAELTWHAAGDVPHAESLALVDGVVVKRFTDVSVAIEYRARTADGAAIGPYRIVPVDPLFVSDLRVEVVYPPHTGLQPEEYRGTVPALRLPVGTRLAVDGRASRPLSEAVLVDSAGERVFSPRVDGARFEGDWRPSRNGRFAWSFLDADGAPAAVQPEPWDIVLVPDSAPSVSIPIPGRDTILPLNLQQPLILEAHDDYGLRRLELVAYRVTAFGEAQDPVTQGLDLGGTRAAIARPLLDLSSWGLMPGDQVRYFARAVDNGPRGQDAVSREYVLRMPLAAELRRDAEEALDDMARRLEELAGEAEAEAEATRDLQRQAAAEGRNQDQRGSREETSGGTDYEKREELRKALEDQKALTERVDSMTDEVEALRRTMQEAGQSDPELAAELQELQELLQEIAGEQLQEQLQRMAEGLDEQDLTRAAEQLGELGKEQDAFRERLEQSLERFRRAAVEQDFRATRSEAEELARQEEALADAMKEADKPELRAEQQEELESRAEELQSQMERLQERLEKLGEQDAASEVAQARERTEQAREQMSEAQRQAAGEEPQDAGERAQEAAETMQSAAEQLEEAQQQMQQEKARAAQEALRRAGDDALSLARRQGELRERMDGASQERLAEMRADEAALLQGVRNLAQNLQTGTEGAADGNQELSAQMGRAMESLQRTIQALEGRRSSAASPQAAADGAVDDLNQLALMAMAGAEQMSQQQGQGGGQSGEQVAEQLQQLAQEQGELSNQTSQLTPMQLGEQALREQLQRLSEEQQSVAEDLEKLSEEEGAEERSLGSLEQMAAEAEALARQMAAGRLTPETAQRQQQLFHRLLDAGRSLQKEDEDFSDERESETAGAFERGDVLPLGDERLGAQRFRVPDAERLQRLPPAVRRLVVEYFERLNAGGAAGAVPPGGAP